MDKAEKRLQILDKIKEYEAKMLWDQDVEEDPPTIVLQPNKVDYLNKKLSSKILTKIANCAATNYFEKLIKNKQMIIEDIVGIDNYLSVEGGAIITCNHFNPCDNYAVWRAIKPYMGRKRLYKVVREGNYTNFPGVVGFFFRHCNTLPLSSNTETMKKFMCAIDTILRRGDKILIYPEQSMWWNYRKPRPCKNGAYKLAVASNVPIIPVFITMRDSDNYDSEGFKVQKYTIHFLPPIYAKENLSKKENVEYLRQENYKMCVEVYENFYHKKLEY